MSMIYSSTWHTKESPQNNDLGKINMAIIIGGETYRRSLVCEEIERN